MCCLPGDVHEDSSWRICCLPSGRLARQAPSALPLWGNGPGASTESRIVVIGPTGWVELSSDLSPSIIYSRQGGTKKTFGIGIDSVWLRQSARAVLSKSKPYREALKSQFYPFVADLDFVRGRANALSVPFHRVRDSKIHWFEIQWDKYHRPLFVLNFSELDLDEGISVEQSLSDRYALNIMGRVQRSKGGGLSNWFQARKPWKAALPSMSFRYTPDDVATQLIHSFSDLEEWWETKNEGPHIYVI